MKEFTIETLLSLKLLNENNLMELQEKLIMTSEEIEITELLLKQINIKIEKLNI